MMVALRTTFFDVQEIRYLKKPLKQPSSIISPQKNTTRTIKVPGLDVDFTVDAGTLELPFKVKGGNIPIVTFKQRLTLVHKVKEGILGVHSQSLPIKMDLPDAYNKLKEAPRIHSKPEDIETILPEYVKLKNYQHIEEIPLQIIVKEIKGTIDWRD